MTASRPIVALARVATLLGIVGLGAANLTVGPVLAADTVGPSLWPELGKVTKLEANFVQVQHRKILKKPLESRGTVRFARPSSLVWNVLSPAKSTFSLEGSKATMDVPDVGSHEVLDLAAVPDASRLATSLMVWLKADAAAVDHDFTATYVQSPPSVKLAPKDERLGKLVTSVNLDLATNPWRVSAVHFTEPTGDSVDIRFTGVKLDGVSVADPTP